MHSACTAARKRDGVVSLDDQVNMVQTIAQDGELGEAHPKPAARLREAPLHARELPRAAQRGDVVTDPQRHVHRGRPIEPWPGQMADHGFSSFGFAPRATRQGRPGTGAASVSGRGRHHRGGSLVISIAFSGPAPKNRCA
jgi:hypothetical protein